MGRGAASRCLAVAGLLLGQAAGAPAKVYQEQDGAVIMEVESCPPASGWKPGTDLEGFTGRCYYTWTGANRFRTPGEGVLTYRFDVTRPGAYQLRLHNRHDFHDSTEQNDCWTKLDDGKWTKTFSSQRGQWTWRTNHEHGHNSKPPASYHLAAGPHTLQIAGRSTGFSIDRIVLHADGVKDALDVKRPETTGLPEMPPLARLKSVAALWQKGELGAALRAAEPHTAAQQDDVATEAKAVVAALQAYASERREALAALKTQDPLAAVRALAALAQAFERSALGDQLLSTAREWNAEPATERCRAAESALARIEAAAAALRGKGAPGDKASASLARIRKAVAELIDKYPDTRAAHRAKQLAKDLGD